MRNIKRLILFGLILSFSLASFGLGMFQSSPVIAACNNVSSFGSVVYSISDISNTKDRVVWVRIKSPDNPSKVMVEVNESECFEAGGFEQQPNEWSWQTNRNDSQIVPISFESNKNNQIKIIGMQDGVKVDKILITDQSCIPIGLGDNCSNGESYQEESSNEYIILESPKDYVSGKVVLSETPSLQGSSLTQVRYLVNGTAIQVSNTAEPFDTTLLKNGDHKVYIITESKGQEPIKESISIRVKNDENAFTGMYRWVRLNQQLAIIILAIVLSIISIIVILFFARRQYKNKRQNKFRGL